MYGIGEVKTSLSNTDHTQFNCGMGLYDKNKVYYMNDVDGKVIVDGKRCTVLSKEGYENTAVLTLGDKKYNVVKMPDGKYWLAEELDWLADGITLITSGNATYSIPAACYCNYVNTGLGLLYNKHAIALLGSILPVGWRISTENDWLNLLTSIGGNDSTHIAKLKSSKTISFPSNHSNFEMKRKEWMENLKEIDEDHFLVPKKLESIITSPLESNKNGNNPEGTYSNFIKNIKIKSNLIFNETFKANNEIEAIIAEKYIKLFCFQLNKIYFRMIWI